MNNFELCQKLGTPTYSSTNISIIPIDNGSKVLLVPSVGSFFDTTVLIKESKTTYFFGPFDPNVTNTKRNFTEIYEYLTDDDNLLSESDTIESDSEQKEYEVEKDYVNELLDSKNNTLLFVEFMPALTEILERFPIVTLSNTIARETTADDIILILEDLLEHNIRIEDALQEMINFSSAEFNSLVLAKDKISKYSNIVGLDS